MGVGIRIAFFPFNTNSRLPLIKKSVAVLSSSEF